MSESRTLNNRKYNCLCEIIHREFNFQKLITVCIRNSNWNDVSTTILCLCVSVKCEYEYCNNI